MIGVSVVIPAFKRLEQTEIAIQKLLSSKGIGTEFSLEIIVADNTPDDSLKLHIEKVFGPSVMWVHPDKNSIAAAKNYGARHATYSLIIFCDSDIEVEEETLMHTLTALQKHTKASMVGGDVIWKGGEKDGQTDRPSAEDRMYKHEETTYSESLYSRYVATYKKVFETVGGYDEEVFGMRGEGSDLSVRYWRSGFPLVYDEKIIVHHVFDAPDSAAIRVANPKWGVIKDWLLLGLRYNCFDGTAAHFEKTVALAFSSSENPTYLTLEALAHNSAFITKVLPSVKNHTEPFVYPFRFLEVFSDEAMLLDCITKAKQQ